MPRKILFIGGSGEISQSCVDEAVRAGHQVTVLNRGQRSQPTPGVESLVGDVSEAEVYAQLADTRFDVVCQFLVFTPIDVQRDIEFFSGRCEQYIFISSASAYQKPWPGGVITEETALDNPFMSYSRNKAACEDALNTAHVQGKLPVTIVRPSHTYRERLPSTVIDGVHLLWRIQSGKPVVVHDDGETLWTVTRSEDFARAFVALCGNSAAIGETFHITDSHAHSWNSIVETIGELAGHDVSICHVGTQSLVDARPELQGPLLGDKANSAVFDNTKISSVADGWHCDISLREGVGLALICAREQLAGGYHPSESDDVLIDKIIDAN